MRHPVRIRMMVPGTVSRFAMVPEPAFACSIWAIFIRSSSIAMTGVLPRRPEAAFRSARFRRRKADADELDGDAARLRALIRLTTRRAVGESDYRREDARLTEYSKARILG
jgi:hypothetical protein